MNETSTFTNPAEKEAAWRAEVASLKEESTTLLASYPVLLQSLERYWSPPRRTTEARVIRGPSTEPFTNAVYEAAQYVDASDPTYTFPIYKPGEARDVPLMRAGNYSAPGDIVPRRFLSVLANGEGAFCTRVRAKGARRTHLHRCTSVGRAGDRQPRLGLAFRPADCVDVERFRHAGRPAVASRASRRSRGSFRGRALVDEMAAQGDHAVGRLSAVERTPAGCSRDRSNQRAAVAHEPAAARCRGVSRFARPRSRTARRADRRHLRQSRCGRFLSTNGVRPSVEAAACVRPRAVRLSRCVAERARSRGHGDVAAADFHDEQSVHSEPGESRRRSCEDRSRRGRADRYSVSQNLVARADGGRTEAARCSICSKAPWNATRRCCCPPMRRLCGHDFETHAARDDRNARRRAGSGRIGRCIRRLVRKAPAGSRPWQRALLGSRTAGEGQARDHAVHDGRSLSARHV